MAKHKMLVKNAKKQVQRTGHIVSHTHWDREWRYPMWETWLMLVDSIDELVEILERDLYPGFLLDGQVSPVLDYLEIRPEMTNRVKALIKADKLQIGPWYTLPDEYPVDGEAMVRNLLWGIRKSQELGGAFKVGYTPFGWGQTAQLPQLYAGFGMDVAMIGKRVNKQRSPQCEFVWRAPDGSELLSTRFGELGRQNFYFKIHLSSLFGIDHEGSDWEYDWSKGGVAYHRADRTQMEQDHFRLDAPQKWYPQSITPKLIEECWQTMDESLLPDDRLMMNGCDYTAAQKIFPEMLERINEVDSDKSRRWIHTTMTKYVELMWKKIDRSKLSIVEGELRDGSAIFITGNALATRLYIKRLNKKAQNLLIRFAEPLSILAQMAGATSQKPLLDKAWQLLLDSHPHDSINGVTQDMTARDVCSRLDQVIEIAEALGNRAMQDLVQRIDMNGFDDKDVLLVVFNSLPYPRHDVLETWVNMLGQTPEDKLAPVICEGLQVFDADGKAVGTQWQGSSNELYPVAEVHTRAFPFHCRRHRIFFDAGMIPAGGYKIFRVGSLEEKRNKKIAHSDSTSRTSTLLSSPTSIENEFMLVAMNSDGSFNLTDKRLKHTWHNLNYYEDRGEMGNYWVNKIPMFDEAYTSVGCAARIWAQESGPLRTTLVSEITMKLPQRGDYEQQKRSDALVDLTIRTAVTLQAGQEYVEVMVDFENRLENHYLRAMFPTGLSKAMHADAGGHFTVDRRPIRPQGPDEYTVWPDMGTLPQNNFVDVSDGNIGIAFLNDSLTEYEVLDNKERTVALSLLRSVNNWICTESRVGSGFPSQKGGQCLGHHNIRYAIKPHAGTWQDADIPLAAELFNVPPVSVQTRKHKGSLPAKEASLFAIDNPVMRFSALKKTEDRDTFVVCLYNPTEEFQKANVKFHTPIAEAWLTNLNEERDCPLKPAKNNVISVTAMPYKIVTIEIKTILKGK